MQERLFRKVIAIPFINIKLKYDISRMGIESEKKNFGHWGRVDVTGGRSA